MTTHGLKILFSTLTLLIAAAGTAEERIVASAPGNRLISVRIGAEAPLVPGRPASVVAIIRNTTADGTYHVQPVAVALRGVFWGETGADSRSWLTLMPGSVTERPNGLFAYNERSIGAKTHLAFETGLILPGEELRVPLPPRADGRHELVIQYVVISGKESWKDDVWLPERASPVSPGGPERVFRPATSERVAERKGGGGLAIVRSTADLRASLPVQSLTRAVELPVRAAP
jgi:hypothetical protein